MQALPLHQDSCRSGYSDDETAEEAGVFVFLFCLVFGWENTFGVTRSLRVIMLLILIII